MRCASSATLKLRIEQVGAAKRAEFHNKHGVSGERDTLTETPDTRQSNYKIETHQTETPAKIQRHRQRHRHQTFVHVFNVESLNRSVGEDVHPTLFDRNRVFRISTLKA